MRYTRVMSKKTIVMIFATIGLTVGSFIPALWGGSLLGGWSIFLSFVGGMAGVWAGVKVSNYF